MVYEDLPKYTDFDSIIHAFEISVKRHKNNPFIHYQQQRLPNSQVEYKTLSYKEVDRITTYLANEWKPALLIPGSDTSNSDTSTQCIASIGHESAIQSALIFFTILKLGLPYYPIAAWSTGPVTLHLLQQGNPSRVITSESYFNTKLNSSTTMTISDDVTIPVKPWKEYDIDYLIKVSETIEEQPMNDKKKTVPYPGPDDMVMVAVTGGTTTGFPKATIRDNRSFLYQLIEISLKNPDLGDNDNNQISLQDPRTIAMKSTEVHVITAPLDRSSSIYQLLYSMILGSSVLIFRHDPPSTWHEIFVASNKFNASWIFTVPFLLDRLADYLQKCFSGNEETEASITAATALKGLKGFSTGGAPLRLSTEKMLKSQGVILRTVYAATEFNRLGNNFLDGTLGTNRFIFPENAIPYILFEPYDHDLYQLVVSSDYPGLVPNAGNRPNGDFATKDLFVTNEQDKLDNIWTLVGRANDVFTMENNKKVCPSRLESEVLYEDIIQNCMLIGENKNCTALLVELAVDKATKYSPTNMITKVYEAVRRANKHVPSYYAVAIPEMIHILPLNKKLPLTMKGTVFRTRVHSEFDREIKQIYNKKNSQ